MHSTSKDTELWGHPKGLYLLFSTEMWERFSYYAMRALLVLYLVDQVQTQGGGLGWDHASALKLYGSFTMLVYVTPLIGGWLADNYLGQRNAILPWLASCTQQRTVAATVPLPCFTWVLTPVCF